VRAVDRRGGVGAAAGRRRAGRGRGCPTSRRRRRRGRTGTRLVPHPPGQSAPTSTPGVAGCCTCLLATWFAVRRVRRLKGASPVGKERLSLGAARLKTRAPKVCGAAPVRSFQTGDRLRRGTAMGSTAPPQRPSRAPVPFPPLPPTCILPRAPLPRCIALALLFFNALVASDIDRNGVFPTGDAVAATRGTPSPPTGGGAACAAVRGGFLVRRRQIAVGGGRGGT